MTFPRLNLWALAVLGWIGVIFFSSTSLAAEWCEHAFSFLSGILFGHLRTDDPSYGLLHLLADKGLHVMMFLILATLLWKLLSNSQWKIARILLAGALVGSCSEFLQRFFPGRDPAITDVLINIGGTAIGIVLSLALARRQTPKAASPELVSCVSTPESQEQVR